MSLKYIIPIEDLDQLLCSSCGNQLSIFPIFITRENSAVICGRCTPFNKDNLIRDDAYEAIAEYLLFPCRFKSDGCEEELTPHLLEEHEVTCLFRKFDCPTKVYTKCNWVGLRTELVRHFEAQHPLLLVKTGEFDFDFGTSHKKNLLLPFEDELFLVKEELDTRNQNFSCSVQHLAPNSNAGPYDYVIKLLSNDKNLWCKLPKKSVKDSEVVTVNNDSVKEKLKDPAFVVVQIDIAKTQTDSLSNKSVEESETTGLAKNAKLDWEILNELECPVCYDIMCSPIYQCSKGHSICSTCKQSITSCPLCRMSDTLNTRNYALEKLTLFLTYPCKFYKVGCNYSSKSSEIKQHETKCEFGPYLCPLNEAENCQLKINKCDIISHIENQHSSFITKSHRITSPFQLDDPRQCFYLKKFSDNVFLVRYKYMNRKFYWTVQLVGSVEECKNFKFDVDLIDNSKNKLRCYLKGFCTSIREQIDFTDPSKYIMLTYEQIQPLITSTIDYNINIVTD